MNFNPDPSKQDQEVVCSSRINKVSHPPAFFKNSTVNQVSSQKRLRLILESTLSFEEHIKKISSKVSKTIGLIRKLHNFLLYSSLITIYESFIRLHEDYGDVIFDKVFNKSFQQKLETIHYNAALSIADSIRDFSNEKLYQELGLEIFQNFKESVTSISILFNTKAQ